jgi:hypothetical protein
MKLRNFVSILPADPERCRDILSAPLAFLGEIAMGWGSWPERQRQTGCTVRRKATADTPVRGQKILRVEGPGFVGGAVWRREAGLWSCVEVTSTLSWMRGLDPDRTKVYLERRGWTYSWGDDTATNRKQVGLIREVAVV